MTTLLLLVIYIAFIGLGIPDSLFGTAWPAIYTEFDLPISFASFVTVIISCGTIVSSMFSAEIINRFGTNKVSAFSTALTAVALLGFSISGSLWLLCAFAVPLGLGAGAIDTALNNYVAVHYSATHMCFLHCFYGIGEVGIDLYWDKTFREEQMIVFEEQVKWALEYDLPLIIHCREAYPELLEVLSGYKHTALRGIFHSFTGTSEDAERLLEYESFMLGINGVVTFKKSTLPEVLKNVPLKRVVLETDSPYLAPVPYRGKRNESANLVKVAECLSIIYGVPLSEIASRTTENALKVFTNAEKSF